MAFHFAASAHLERDGERLRCLRSALSGPTIADSAKADAPNHPIKRIVCLLLWFYPVRLDQIACAECL